MSYNIIYYIPYEIWIKIFQIGVKSYQLISDSIVSFLYSCSTFYKLTDDQFFMQNLLLVCYFQNTNIDQIRTKLNNAKTDNFCLSYKDLFFWFYDSTGDQRLAVNYSLSLTRTLQYIPIDEDKVEKLQEKINMYIESMKRKKRWKLRKYLCVNFSFFQFIASGVIFDKIEDKCTKEKELWNVLKRHEITIEGRIVTFTRKIITFYFSYRKTYKVKSDNKYTKKSLLKKDGEIILKCKVDNDFIEIWPWVDCKKDNNTDQDHQEDILKKLKVLLDVFGVGEEEKIKLLFDNFLTLPFSDWTFMVNVLEYYGIFEKYKEPDNGLLCDYISDNDFEGIDEYMKNKEDMELLTKCICVFYYPRYLLQILVYLLFPLDKSMSSKKLDLFLECWETISYHKKNRISEKAMNVNWWFKHF